MFKFPLLFQILLTGTLFSAQLSYAIEHRNKTRISPDDYLLKSYTDYHDTIFDNYRVVDLSASLGVGSDCGRIDFKSTLQSSLKNILDTKYFGQMGHQILASSPMLLTCYFSPTWCAILKHSQVNAQWMSQLRLDQCSVIDKYVDHRSEDFFKERQGCVRQAIDSNGGNLEQALEQCPGNTFQADLTNWAGKSYGEKTGSNQLIGSSAKWAGLDSNETKPSVELLKALVGDTVVSKGSVSVDYGPRQTPLSPRTYLLSIQKATHDKLCGTMLTKISALKPGSNLDGVISESDLKGLDPVGNSISVDRQTLRSLSYMPSRQREMACQKLSDAVSLTLFSGDVNRSLDLLTTLSQNPNLPDTRRQEIEQKRKALKESIDATVSLYHQKNVPLTSALHQINEEGEKLQGRAVHSALTTHAQAKENQTIRSRLMDCADGVMCEGTRP